MVAFCGICRRGFKEWADLHNHNMSKHRDRINPPWAVPGLPPPPQWPARPLPPPPPLAYQQHQQGGGAMAFPVAPPPPPPGLPSYVTRSIPLALTSSPGPAPFTIKVDPAASSVATADEQVNLINTSSNINTGSGSSGIKRSGEFSGGGGSAKRGGGRATWETSSVFPEVVGTGTGPDTVCPLATGLGALYDVLKTVPDGKKYDHLARTMIDILTKRSPAHLYKPFQNYLMAYVRTLTVGENPDYNAVYEGLRTVHVVETERARRASEAGSGAGGADAGGGAEEVVEGALV